MAYRLVILVLTGLVGGVAAAAQETEDWREKAGPDGAPDSIAPLDTPFEMEDLQRPSFPDRVFPITDYGAAADDDKLDTAAFAAAIEACAKAGGGVVDVPAGTWLTGAIHLRSNVNLHLAEGAVLRFSDNPEHYLPVVFTRWAGFECYNYSPLIYARDCENIAVTGSGTIDGNGRPWWPWFERQAETAEHMYHEQVLKGVPPGERVYGTVEAGLRPQLISPINCRNVLLEDFTIAEPGPFWTIDLVYCDRVIARKLRILTEGGPNTDGLNADSSTNVLIEHCYFNTGDDCIAIKSGMNEDGWRAGKPARNIVARYNMTEKGHGGTVFGSDVSGGIQNVYVHSSVFNGTLIGLRFKATRGRGGLVENVFCRNIDMTGIEREAIQMTTAYRAWMATTEGRPPVFRAITFQNIRVEGAEEAIRAEGLPEALMQGLRFEDVSMRATKGIDMKWVADITFKDLHVRCEETPALRLDHCHDITAEGSVVVEAGG